jgi:hypothetical protein
VSIELILRSIVAGAYLVALTLNGRFDLLTALLALGMVLVWAVPQLRRMADRRRTSHHSEA